MEVKYGVASGGKLEMGWDKDWSGTEWIGIKGSAWLYTLDPRKHVAFGSIRFHCVREVSALGIKLGMKDRVGLNQQGVGIGFGRMVCVRF